MCFRFRAFPFQSAFFRPLLFRFWLLSLCFFLSFSSRFRLTAASPVRPSTFASWLSPFFPARFPVLSFPFLVLGFLFVSFRPSLIRSHSCFSGAYLMLSLSVFPLPIRFLSSASLPVLATQPLFLLFRSSRPRLTAASPVRPSAFASLAFPVPSDLVSRVLSPGSLYSAFCQFPFAPP